MATWTMRALVFVCSLVLALPANWCCYWPLAGADEQEAVPCCCCCQERAPSSAPYPAPDSARYPVRCPAQPSAPDYCCPEVDATTPPETVKVPPDSASLPYSSIDLSAGPEQRTLPAAAFAVPIASRAIHLLDCVWLC